MPTGYVDKAEKREAIIQPGKVKKLIFWQCIKFSEILLTLSTSMEEPLLSFFSKATFGLEIHY